MPINFSDTVYAQAQATFGRSITVYPSDGSPSYVARGIYDTAPMDVVGEDGSVLSDQRTILDIRDAEFAVLPKQGDRINIPTSGGIPAAGLFEVLDADSNGGGETTLGLRKVVDAAP